MTFHIKNPNPTFLQTDIEGHGKVTIPAQSFYQAKGSPCRLTEQNMTARLSVQIRSGALLKIPATALPKPAKAVKAKKAETKPEEQIEL